MTENYAAEAATKPTVLTREDVDELYKDWVCIFGVNVGSAELCIREIESAVLFRLRALVDGARAAHIKALQDLRLGVEMDRHNLPDGDEKIAALDAALASLRAPVAKPSIVSEDFAQEVWAAAQSPHGEPMEKSVARVASLLAEFSAPVAGETQTAASAEHYGEVKFTLQGAHRIMESLSAIERRVGPVGSHARGYTHKITNALRHLDALYAARQASERVSAPSAETLRLAGVIADKIEDGTLFQGGILSRRELADKVRAVVRFAQQSAPVADR